MEFLWPLAGLLTAVLWLKLWYDSYEKVTFGFIIYVFVVSTILGFISLVFYGFVWLLTNVNLDFLGIVIFEKKKEK
jgi:biotin transporter BioY